MTNRARGPPPATCPFTQPLVIAVQSMVMAVAIAGRCRVNGHHSWCGKGTLGFVVRLLAVAMGMAATAGV
jgi:hypothetical protein